MTLDEAYVELARALVPLGIEPDRAVVLAIWRDRRRFGNDPLPGGALRELAETIERLLEQDAPTD